jgi:hypothetical protein
MMIEVNAPVTRGSILMIIMIKERKFRSQTSDNMDKWKSRSGNSQRRGEEEEDQGRERVRRKKMQMHEKVGKSRFTVFFQ